MHSRDPESRSSLVFVLLSAVVTCTSLSHVTMNFHTLFDFVCTMTTRQTGTKQFEIACSGDMHVCALLCHAQLTFVWRSTTQLS